MRKGDILFVRGNSCISKIINYVDGPYSHVALALSDDTILEAQRFTESRIVKNYHVDYDVYRLKLTDEQRDMLVECALRLIGRDYDYTQVFGTLFNRLFRIARKNNRNKFICSELIVEMLYSIGYIDECSRESLIHSTPNELYKYIHSAHNTLQ